MEVLSIQEVCDVEIVGGIYHVVLAHIKGLDISNENQVSTAVTGVSIKADYHPAYVQIDKKNLRPTGIEGAYLVSWVTSFFGHAPCFICEKDATSIVEDKQYCHEHAIEARGRELYVSS